MKIIKDSDDTEAESTNRNTTDFRITIEDKQKGFDLEKGVLF